MGYRRLDITKKEAKALCKQCEYNSSCQKSSNCLPNDCLWLNKNNNMNKDNIKYDWSIGGNLDDLKECCEILKNSGIYELGITAIEPLEGYILTITGDGCIGFWGDTKDNRETNHFTLPQDKDKALRYILGDSYKPGEEYSSGDSYKKVVSRDKTCELSVDDLVEGEIYHVSYPEDSHEYILKNNLHREYICITNSFYSIAFNASELYNYTLASESDKQWLEACSKADKYIPKEEALKSKEDMPEPKFKVGDRVRITNTGQSYSWFGDFYFGFASHNRIKRGEEFKITDLEFRCGEWRYKGSVRGIDVVFDKRGLEYIPKKITNLVIDKDVKINDDDIYKVLKNDSLPTLKLIEILANKQTTYASTKQESGKLKLHKKTKSKKVILTPISDKPNNLKLK